MVNEALSHIRKNKNMYLEVEIEKAECEPDYGQLSYQLEVEDNWYYWDHRGDEDDSDWRSRKSRNVESPSNVTKQKTIKANSKHLLSEKSLLAKHEYFLQKIDKIIHTNCNHNHNKVDIKIENE